MTKPVDKIIADYERSIDEIHDAALADMMADVRRLLNRCLLFVAVVLAPIVVAFNYLVAA